LSLARAAYHATCRREKKQTLEKIKKIEWV